ncbi:chemotaxis protein CheW [Massilia sp. NR 4-1]|uniref:chemotaxis protein CheW n=1 Tax=Massilia sp. NR 4-1 TaxID=1678028 RepID=UPI001CC0EE79|nr:chemotaxis protein CheW [Massilia sp. NR 4-1]
MMQSSNTPVLGQPGLAPPPPDAGPRQYLTFRLGGLEYAIDYRKVRELRPFKTLERFAADGEIVKGVALSRGVIMPIVDMRVAFGPRPASENEIDVVILKLSSCIVGMVTDGVTDIVEMGSGQIAPLPDVGEEVDYLIGLGEAHGRKLIVLDIDKLMSLRQASLGSQTVAA